MKRLILVRHAKSSWTDMGLSDFERPLNDRGMRDAPMMGQRLCELMKRPTFLVTSPAHRARTTAQIIAGELTDTEKPVAEDDRIYAAGVPDLMAVVQDLDDRHDHVLLVGHNPGLTDLSAALTGFDVGNIPTCGVFCTDLEIASWSLAAPGCGAFVFFDYPKRRPAS